MTCHLPRIPWSLAYGVGYSYWPDHFNFFIFSKRGLQVFVAAILMNLVVKMCLFEQILCY